MRIPEILRQKLFEPGSGLPRSELVAYSIMWRETARRLLVLVLSVALATAFVSHAVQAAHPDTAVATMSGDMPMHGKCDGCAGNEKAMPSAACAFSFCSLAAVAPVTMAFDAVSSEALEPAAGSSVTGHVFPPDPYPPRASILS
jgi:hypothetical protein